MIFFSQTARLRLKITKAEKERLARRSKVNAEAYQAYLKGRFYWNKRTKEGLLKGLDYFKKAIDSDPGYALAYVGVADSYIMLAFYNYLPPKEAMPMGKEAALKALEIDDALGEAHNSLAYVKSRFEWNWIEAEKEFKRAIELSPNYATAHHWYAILLAQMGRSDEAYEERASYIIYVKVDPKLDSLRSEPRFKALMAKLKLE